MTNYTHFYKRDYPWVGQQQHKWQEKSEPHGSVPTVNTKQTAQTSDSKENSRHGKNACPILLCNVGWLISQPQISTLSWPFKERELLRLALAPPKSTAKAEPPQTSFQERQLELFNPKR